MPETKILITGKTKYGSLACIGALSLVDGESFRLKTMLNSYWPADDFSIGEAYTITYQRKGDENNPHQKENIVVVRRKPAGRLSRASIAGLIRRGGLVEKTNDPRRAFRFEDGGVHFSEEYGKLFIDQKYAGLLLNSVGFIEPDIDICADRQFQNYRFGSYRIKYVGFDQPVSVIKAGTIVRLSTSSLWQKPNTDERRVYLQVSGWF